MLQISAGLRLQIGQSLIAFTSSGIFPYNQLFDIYALSHLTVLENTDENNIRYPGLPKVRVEYLQAIPVRDVDPANP